MTGGGAEMGPAPRLLAFAGSTRRHSYNGSLVATAIAGAEAAGADVTLIQLRDFPLPIYDADLEASSGMPENALALRELFESHSGWLISAPEYNGSLPGVLKNTIDWVSRPAAPGETDTTLKAFRGKVAGIMSASPGPWGGMRGLFHLRQILSGMYVLVVAEQLAVGNAKTAFDENGRLVNDAQRVVIENIGRRVADVTRRLNSP